MSKVSENFPLSSLSTGAQRQRVILLDVDGTVVDYSNQLPDSAVQAVRLARAAGHLVYHISKKAAAMWNCPIRISAAAGKPTRDIWTSCLSPSKVVCLKSQAGAFPAVLTAGIHAPVGMREKLRLCEPRAGS